MHTLGFHVNKVMGTYKKFYKTKFAFINVD